MISTSLSLTSDYYSGSDLDYDDDDDVVKAAPHHHHTSEQPKIILQTLLQHHHHHYPPSSLSSTTRLHHSLTLLKVTISISCFLLHPYWFFSSPSSRRTMVSLMRSSFKQTPYFTIIFVRLPSVILMNRLSLHVYHSQPNSHNILVTSLCHSSTVILSS